MAKKFDRLEEIEREGYLAAINGEGKSSHIYQDKQKQMVFDSGYYKGLLELKHRRDENKGEGQNVR